MSSLDTTINRKRRLKSRLGDLLQRVEIYGLSHDEYLTRRTAEIFESDDWKRAPEWVKSYLRGYEDGFMVALWREVVFSYEIDGKRLAIDTPEYRAIPPKRVNDEFSDTGAYIWRKSGKFWTLPKGVPACPQPSST